MNKLGESFVQIGLVAGMVLRWVACAAMTWVVALVVWFTAWFVAFGVNAKTIEGRQVLRKYVSWYATHDHPVDEWWMADNPYFEDCKWFAWYTREMFAGSVICRYLGRLFWICRNPGYTFSYKYLGFTKTVLYTETNLWTVPGWEQGKNNIRVLFGTSPDEPWWRRYTFHIRGQFYFTRNRYLHVNIGWKGHKGFTGQICAALVSPFRKYKV